MRFKDVLLDEVRCGWWAVRHPRATLKLWPEIVWWLQMPSVVGMALMGQRLLAWVLLSRIIFAVLGVHMVVSQLPTLMQLFPLEWYGEGFWQRLWNLHSQPPLFLVMTWLVHHLAPWHLYAVVAWPLFVLLGMVMAWALYQIALNMKIPPRMAWAGVLLFMVSANTILYETYYLYAYPITVCLVVAVWQLQRHIQQGDAVSAFMACVLLAVPCLMHSLFNIVYLVPLLLVGLAASPRRRVWLVMALLAVAPVAGWYGKNHVMYGMWGASSWAGTTVANITTWFPLATVERESFEQRVPTEVATVARVRPFSPLEDYPSEVWHTAVTGIDVLDNIRRPDGLPNYHHLGQQQVGRLYMQGAGNIMTWQPEVYWRGVNSALYMFLLAPSEWFHTRSKTMIFYYDWAWSFLTTGKLAWTAKSQSQFLRSRNDYAGQIPLNILGYIGYNGPQNFPWFSIVWLPLLMVYGSWKALQHAWRGQRLEAATVWWMMGIIGYVTLASVMLDIGENQRYRYYMSPHMALLALMLATAMARRYVSTSPPAA